MFLVILTENEKNKDTNSDSNADSYFGPFQMACETRHPRVMEIALDSLHYLIGNLICACYYSYFNYRICRTRLSKR